MNLDREWICTTINNANQTRALSLSGPSGGARAALEHPLQPDEIAHASLVAQWCNDDTADLDLNVTHTNGDYLWITLGSSLDLLARSVPLPANKTPAPTQPPTYQ